MKALCRNKRTFYYANYDETSIDDYGNAVVTYGNPVESSANISSASGAIQTELFGSLDSYDKTIICEDPDFELNEYSVLWLDTVPELNEDGTTDTPYDYIVKRVARSLNSVSYAVVKVKVSNE